MPSFSYLLPTQGVLYCYIFFLVICADMSVFLLITTLATCSYLLLGEWPSYGIELTRHCYLEGKLPPTTHTHTTLLCFCSQSPEEIHMYSWLWKKNYWSHTYQLCHIELIWSYIAPASMRKRKKIIRSDIATFHLIFIHWYCHSSSDLLVWSQHIYLCPKS